MIYCICHGLNYISLTEMQANLNWRKATRSFGEGLLIGCCGKHLTPALKEAPVPLPSTSHPKSLILLFLLVFALLAWLVGCDNLSIGGKCYDDNGDELTHVFDEDGTRWDVKKATIEGADYCAIPREAQPFETSAGFIEEVEHPNGQMMQLLGRHQDKWVISPLWAEWY